MKKYKYVVLVIAFILLSAPVHSKGWIRVRTEVVGAQVTIDEGESVVMRGQELSFLVEDGLHLVIVDKEGYLPYFDTVTTRQDVDRFVPAWLEPTSKKAKRNTTSFNRTSWEYQLANGLFALRWAGIGGGIATGLNIHMSFFNMRFGLFTLDPCLWGMNVPFFSGISHVQTPWLVHPRNRRSDVLQYEMAVPNQDLQFYYTPMIGFQLPFSATMAFMLSAGPQISWTHVDWSYQLGDLPQSGFTFTNEPFPGKGFQFDPVWFSVQTGVYFNGGRSDLLTYLKYQDGFFVGMEVRF